MARISLLLPALASLSGCYDYGFGNNCAKQIATYGADEAPETHGTPWSYVEPYDGRMASTVRWGPLGWTLHLDRASVTGDWASFKRRCDSDPNMLVTGALAVEEVEDSRGHLYMERAGEGAQIYLSMAPQGTTMEEELIAAVQRTQAAPLPPLTEVQVYLRNGLGSFVLNFRPDGFDEDTELQVDDRDVSELGFNYTLE